MMKLRTGAWVMAAVGLAAAMWPARPAWGGDWPMFRYDAARSAASPEPLAERLELQWTWDLPTRDPVFGTDRRNPVDQINVPVIAGGLVLVGLEPNHAMYAFDLASGSLKWRFVADAPLRFAPAVAGGTVYAAADDGVLYALDLATGSPRWRYVGAPSPRKIVNHEHLTSAWPASGGPVAADGAVYFSTGVMPVDGTWMHAVNAATGRRLWRSPAAVCWGYGTVIKDWVAVPSGMYPNVFRTDDGQWRRNSFWGVKNLSPNRLVGFADRYIWNGNEIHPLLPGSTGFGSQYVNAEHHANMWPPVVEGDRAYGFNDGILRVMRLPATGEAAPRGRLISCAGEWWVNARPDYAWSQAGQEMPLPAGAKLPAGWYPRRMELKAGPMLVAGGHDAILGIRWAKPGAEKPVVTFVQPVEGKRQEMAAAAGRLVVATETGKLYCFGPDKAQAKSYNLPQPKPAPADNATATAKEVLGATGATAGYAVVLSPGDGRLALELAGQSNLRVIALESASDGAQALRQKLDAQGRLGRNLAWVQGDLAACQLPPYLANLIVCADTRAAAALVETTALAALYQSLRPYGGVACLALDEAAHERLQVRAKELALPKAQVRRQGAWTLLLRPGALPDSDNWTHERYNAAALLCSRDTAVRAPLGMLWYGGPAAQWFRMFTEFLPPAVQTVDGHYIFQGHGLLSAIDVYTGRLMWECNLPTQQFYGNYLDAVKGPDGKPIYPEPDIAAWSGNHGYLKPGEIEIARLCGNAYNMVSLPDEIYLTVAEHLWVVDTATGQVLRKMPMPIEDKEARRPLCWGALRIEGDVAVATAFDPARWRDLYPAWLKGNVKNKQQLPAKWLLAVDRRTGKLLWRRRANQGYVSWGLVLGNGRAYALDQVATEVIRADRAAGAPAPTGGPTVVAMELATGKELWKKPADPLVEDLAFSAPRDLLLLPSRDNTFWRDGDWVPEPAPPSRTEKKSVMRALRGADGSVAWEVKDAEYAEPVLVNGDLVITRRGQGFDLRTGRPAERRNILTGRMEHLTVSTGGCNFLIGSTEFTTHRTCYDQWALGCTVPFDGIRSGCTPSMLVANGVVSIFNQAMEENTELRTCGTMTWRPDNANWTSFGEEGRGGGSSLAVLAGLKAPLEHVALNLAAPRDHVGPGAVPWLRLVREPAAPPPQKGRAPTPPPTIATIEPETVKPFRLPVPHVQPTDTGALGFAAATGYEGVEELTVALAPAEDKTSRRCTVRLHFAEPRDDAKPGERVFDVLVQDKPALIDFDVAKEAGGPRRSIVREVKGVAVESALKVTLRAKAGATLLCAIEVMAEK